MFSGITKMQFEFTFPWSVGNIYVNSPICVCCKKLTLDQANTYKSLSHTLSLTCAEIFLEW